MRPFFLQTCNAINLNSALEPTLDHKTRSAVCSVDETDMRFHLHKKRDLRHTHTLFKPLESQNSSALRLKCQFWPKNKPASFPVSKKNGYMSVGMYRQFVVRSGPG